MVYSRGSDSYPIMACDEIYARLYDVLPHLHCVLCIRLTAKTIGDTPNIGFFVNVLLFSSVPATSDPLYSHPLALVSLCWYSIGKAPGHAT